MIHLGTDKLKENIPTPLSLNLLQSPWHAIIIGTEKNG